MRRVGQVVVLSVAFALATLVLGWWVVPAMAFVWGLWVQQGNQPGKVAALAAGLGWVWLLAWTASVGPAGELARRAAGVFEIPSVALVVITILFPAMVAWAAGVLGGFTAAHVRRQR